MILFDLWLSDISVLGQKTFQLLRMEHAKAAKGNSMDGLFALSLSQIISGIEFIRAITWGTHCMPCFARIITTQL